MGSYESLLVLLNNPLIFVTVHRYAQDAGSQYAAAEETLPPRAIMVGA